MHIEGIMECLIGLQENSEVPQQYVLREHVRKENEHVQQQQVRHHETEIHGHGMKIPKQY